jgi:hypothetical protein
VIVAAAAAVVVAAGAAGRVAEPAATVAGPGLVSDVVGGQHRAAAEVDWREAGEGSAEACCFLDVVEVAAEALHFEHHAYSGDVPHDAAAEYADPVAQLPRPRRQQLVGLVGLAAPGVPGVPVALVEPAA